MSDPLLPIEELQSLKFGISALADLFERGSYKRELALNAARGLEARIEWVIAQLEAAGEGKKNMGAR